MFCVKCGKEIKPGNKFCIYCGEPVAPEESVNEAPEVEAAAEAAPYVEAKTETLFDSENANAYPEDRVRRERPVARPKERVKKAPVMPNKPDKEPDKSGLRVVLILCVALLVLLIAAGAGFGIYMYMNPEQDSSSKELSGENAQDKALDKEDTDINIDGDSGDDSDIKETDDSQGGDDDSDKKSSASSKKDDNDNADDDSEDDGDEEEYQEDLGIHRYEYIIDDVTWKQAYRDCIERGGYLLHINSTEEYEKILEDLDNEDYQKINFYIGGRRDPDTEEYYWINANGDYFGEVLNSPSLAQYWFEGEPSFEGEDEEELFMDMLYRKSDDTWYWNDIPNDVAALSDYFEGRIGYICEFE